MQCVWVRGEAYTGFWWGKMREYGIPRRRWEDNIKTDLEEVDVGMWTGSNWLRTGTGGGNL